MTAAISAYRRPTPRVWLQRSWYKELSVGFIFHRKGVRNLITSTWKLFWGTVFQTLSLVSWFGTEESRSIWSRYCP